MAKKVPQGDIVLVGVDGGATEAKAHHVICEDWDHPVSFRLGEASAGRIYERLPDFSPLAVGEQLVQRDAGDLRLTSDERIQGGMWVQSACDAVMGVVSQVDGGKESNVLIGLGMPGLKTEDFRGVAVLNNGPRIPDYLDQIERRLAHCGVTLAAPVSALGSDADYCGIGELCAHDGLFRDVENAYYVGCGTGIADAMLLSGKLVTFDKAKSWIQKSWQMQSSLGTTFEKLVSAKSMNDVYAGLRGDQTIDEPRFPEVEAAKGQEHPLAIAWMGTISLVLAELVFERMGTILNGRAGDAHRGPGYALLSETHPYTGTLLDRVVIGQRLGQVYSDRRYREVFREKLDACLGDMISSSGNEEMIQAYLKGERLRPGLLRASQLRAAPALGAGVAAARAMR